MFDAIILMAGSGQRSRLDYNKALFEYKNAPLYMTSVKTFLQTDNCHNIILVVAQSDKELVSQQVAHLENVKLVIGGKTRQDSVKNAIREVTSEIVLIHDAARPLVTNEDIKNVFLATKTYGAAVLANKATSSVKIYKNGFIEKSLARDSIIETQTPQGVKTALFKAVIKSAYEHSFQGTDDVELVEKFSQTKVKVVFGSDRNFKVTTPADLKILVNFEED